MNDKYKFFEKPSISPILDKNFRPAVIWCKGFIQSVIKSDHNIPLKIALERGDGLISTYETIVFNDNSGMNKFNNFYIERLVKTLLWSRGGWKIIIGGSDKIGKYIKNAYKPGGLREFDTKFMSKIYEKPFTVLVTDINYVPESNEKTKPLGRHLDGCRIGLDIGGSDYKISTLIDGRVIFSEEVQWYPKLHPDPKYHYNEILKAIKKAASKLPRIDAIGVSAAGIYINNYVMIASLFIKVPDDIFKKKVKTIFVDIQKDMGGVPLEVVNDGDVTALAGAMNLDDTNVLGIAMGTSEAGGFIDIQGNITGWLNELAFIPVDFNPDAIVDEWSGDFGCGVKYFSQDAVIRLAPSAGIVLDESLTPAEKLSNIQDLCNNGDKRARQIFYTIGVYLSYTIVYYTQFYDIKHILVLGRVTSGEGGNIIVSKAEHILNTEFEELSERIKIHLPDESSRRIGQSIVAGSLPEINKDPRGFKQ